MTDMQNPKQAAPAAVAVPVMTRHRTKDGILHFLTKEQMAEEIIRLDAALAAAPAAQAAPADTLAEIVGCIDAANSEGLDDALVNNTDARLTDLVQRRLLPAFYVAIAAQAAQQPAVQHAGALEACRAACDRIIEQYDGVTAGIDWHALRGGIDRTLAAHPAAPVAQGDADPLQGAAQWLLEALEGCNIADLQSRLFIGFNRAERLMLGALAARSQAKEGGAA